MKSEQLTRRNGAHSSPTNGGDADQVRESLAKLLGEPALESERRRIESIEAYREGIATVVRGLLAVGERLAQLESLVGELHELATNAKPAKEWYTVRELAEILGKAEFTVREWCRLGRVNAAKRECGRGKHQEWIVSHEELIRVQNDGILPE